MGSPHRVVPALVLAAVLAAVTGVGAAGSREGEACSQPRLSAGYVQRVARALRGREDVWGNSLLAKRGGPTYEGVRGYLRPLLLARGPRGKPLTSSGFHYVAFTHPNGAEGSGSAALHVADGSQILSQRTAGPSLTIGVGVGGRERFGSCLSRLALPQLADGDLPILETRYVDAQGVRYRQESFAARVPDSATLTSFVRLRADARRARVGTVVRFVPSAGAPLTQVVAARASHDAYVSWTPAGVKYVNRSDYEAARSAVIRYWQDRLAEGATIDVPERRVMDAARNLLVQNLGLTWRYSIGNPYQQFSYPEGIDVAQVMSSYGFSDVADAMLERSLTTPRGPYPNWRVGQKLVGFALHYQLFRDRPLIERVTPTLRAYVDSLGRQLASGDDGLLERERFSSDIPDLVYGLHSQAVALQGLRAMGRVWSDTGNDQLAERCSRLAARLASGLRRAVRVSTRRLPDGSLFIPARLLDREKPYDSLIQARSGSYWNLVMPYALASGLFAPGSPEANGVLRYVQRHGARMLGLVRAGAYSLYGRRARYPTSGVNPVYGLNMARFLADNDRSDQLVLSLYGQLAAGMAPGTFVSGEAASVAPIGREPFRSMYLPPNGASNASLLETLRLMLVHETRDRRGAPTGLQLAFATPRAWLEPGKRIVVSDAPTSFGPLSFSIASRANSVRVLVDVPRLRRPRDLDLRLRLPPGKRIARVLVDGRESRRFDPATETIDLSGRRGQLDVRVAVETN